MSAAANARIIGRSALLNVREHTGTLQVSVIITDVKQAFGHTRYEVAGAVEGQKTIGRAWVDAGRVTLTPKEKS